MQHEQCEQEAGADARADHRPSGRRQEHVVHEGADRRGRLGAERREVDGEGRGEPQSEYPDQHRADRGDPAEGRRTDHAERVGPGRVGPHLAPPAHLIQPHRRQRPDERKAGRKGEQQRQHVVAGCEARQDHADDGIGDAQEHHVGPVGPEVLDPLAQGVQQVGHPDPADLGRRQGAGRLGPGRIAWGRPEGGASGPDVFDTPLDGVADGHDGTSRTQFERSRPLRQVDAG